MNYIGYLIWGFSIGWMSGLMGLGGGVFVIPTLMFLFGMTQHQAQGTSVAMMLPPIGLLAALQYYKEGHVVIPVAIFGAIGFFIGGHFGAGTAVHLSDSVLRKIFGTIMVVMGIKMLFSR
ncbi:MAG: sulfite exporter TauE/SafE family protein [Candidatus Riflebacteria bacterium]|nr:sulfite exporter TauE/SafE family protein [Candidatus Riflebacteria bacterium]